MYIYIYIYIYIYLDDALVADLRDLALHVLKTPPGVYIHQYKQHSINHLYQQTPKSLCQKT